MCGEYLSDSITTAELSGSPPHVWRIHALKDMSKEEIGITSTLVENTDIWSSLLNYFKDHLHTRGEYLHGLNGLVNLVRITSTLVENTNLIMSTALLLVGSPPHSWRILNDPRYINISQSK